MTVSYTVSYSRAFTDPLKKLAIYDSNLELSKTIGEQLDDPIGAGLEITDKYIAHDAFRNKITVYLKNGTSHLVIYIL